MQQRPQRQYKVIRLVAEHPPPTPTCFDSTQVWQDYLLTLHYYGEPLTRRKDTSKRIGQTRIERTVVTVFVEVDYCADCAGGEFKRRMIEQGRCAMHKREKLKRG